MTSLKTNFEPHGLEPFYMSGDIRLMNNDMTLVTPFEDQVIFTDVDSGNRKLVIEGDGEPITAMEVTPDGEFLITCSRSLQMHIYRLPTGELVHRTKAHESPVLSIAVDHTSSLVATGGAEGAVKIWDIEGGFMTHNFRGHGGVISELKFWGQQGSSNWCLASGSGDNKVRIWDLVKSKCLAVLDSHVSIIRGLDFTSDGKTLVSGSRDMVINVWDLNKFKLKTTIPTFDSLESLVLVNDSQIFTGGEKGRIEIFELGKSERQNISKERFQTTEDISISQLVLAHDGQSVYAILSDQTFEQYSIPDLKLIDRIAGNHGEIIDSRFLSNVKMVLATNSPELKITNLKSPLKYDVLEGHKDIVIAVDVTYDGSWIASAGKDNLVILWHENQVHSTYKGHAGTVGAVGLPRVPLATSDKKLILPSFIVSASQDLTVKRWNPANGSCIYTRKAHEKDINALDVSPDNRLFATSSQDRTVKIWDIETGDTIGILKGHKRGVWAVNFSHYDKQIISGSGDKTIKLWNLNDYSCIRTFEGHSGSVLKTLFFNKGTQIVSSSGDGLVKVWDKISGECLTSLDNHEDRVWSLSVNEQDELVSGGADGVLTIWKDITEQTIQEKQAADSKRVEEEQQLENHIKSQRWAEAIRLALDLNHPYRLLKLFREIQQQGQGLSGNEQVDEIIKKELTLQEIGNLLKRVRDWNTSTKNSEVAQNVLHTILKLRGKELSNVPGISELVDALSAYSRRHYTRINGMIDDSYTVEYVLRQMSAL